MALSANDALASPSTSGFKKDDIVADKEPIVKATQEEDLVGEGLTANINPLKSSIVNEDHSQDKVIAEKGIYAIPFYIIHIIHTSIPMY
jgi:hypothetical protein